MLSLTCRLLHDHLLFHGQEAAHVSRSDREDRIAVELNRGGAGVDLVDAAPGDLDLGAPRFFSVSGWMMASSGSIVTSRPSSAPLSMVRVRPRIFVMRPLAGIRR